MKICITSEGNTLDSLVDPRFGRCRYFIIVDSDTIIFEAVENASAAAGGGAGIQAGQLMAAKGVKAVLTGNVGPNAFQTLSAAGIDIFTGITGTVKEAIDKFKQGSLKAEAGPTVSSHSGMK
ncbi:MAG: dinitrogenase iron-molybdenum cofactor biosynthesis protein [Elusimicrobia bacterium RIFOXYB2_FULL_48_7]|nr:MAG: dinitrogenase iron-molybdenum cofactor biosynthesis protein [Elusimicrobia bacterium RIFOXYB2_FULL_48_7]